MTALLMGIFAAAVVSMVSRVIDHASYGSSGSNYGRPLSVSGRPCYILSNVFFIYFYGRLILRPWLTEVRESFTRGGP